MTISYHWLSEYLPVSLSPEKLSEILTSIGLEVESLSHYESIKGGLEGLLAGEVLTCEKHPDADKLKLTTVDIGATEPLQIVCGAPNVATGQKVIVAPVGTTLYPLKGDAFSIKKAKIRGIESQGMICAEDEIGLSEHHDGIKVLPPDTTPGMKIADLFAVYRDYIFEIGLTPNRMDAMSHLGVAKDVCAYLSHHEKKSHTVNLPFPNNLVSDHARTEFQIVIENSEACKRYAGVSIQNIQVAESPQWLQQRLLAIGLRPINNIVDITNYILHETGQPLHAFDADSIKGNKIIVKNVAEGTVFKTLDDKERKLTSNDLMICNEKEAMCIAGVYGGAESGVTNHTKNIFLESAFFEGSVIRKTSLQHGLRTDAATRFEKGTDISNVVNVLQRAALLIKETAGGVISGEIIDVYPQPTEKTQVKLSLGYLTKLSGKIYPQNDVKNILIALGFEIVREHEGSLEILVPFSKPDISIQADIVEEIMRIDGLDNIEIPTSITITPSVEKQKDNFSAKEKTSGFLVGMGFREIFTNSISNSGYYNQEQLSKCVKMINSLSAELDILRPDMMHSGLQVVAHNLNRKNNNQKLFEFGKTYIVDAEKKYSEKNHISLFITGNLSEKGWREEVRKADYFYIKGVISNIIKLLGFGNIRFDASKEKTTVIISNTSVGHFGEVAGELLKKFDIKHPVFFADLDWDQLLSLKRKAIQYTEIPKFPFVSRDLALLVDKNVSYSALEHIALTGKISQLKKVELFDIFESEKLGKDKKSIALNFTFLDESKTLTDKEIDGFMQNIVANFEKEAGAEIRK
ncbi:MAG: phenylalanine--tRNA ligase subunit beta [Ferruginibacter sp.]|nr:phenylalanine--tRNA ligase subunit beta [Ferruginibacter sp.]